MDAKIEPLALALKDFEKKHVMQAMELAGNDEDDAADLLGISMKTLRQKLDKHGLSDASPPTAITSTATEMRLSTSLAW